MKVIAKISRSQYVCDVTHTEIKKFLNRYYGSGSLGILEVGQEIDLGKGYDFRSDIRDAMQKTQEFIEGHEKVVTAILNGLKFL